MADFDGVLRCQSCNAHLRSTREAYDGLCHRCSADESRAQSSPEQNQISDLEAERDALAVRNAELEAVASLKKEGWRICDVSMEDRAKTSAASVAMGVAIRAMERGGLPKCWRRNREMEFVQDKPVMPGMLLWTLTGATSIEKARSIAFRVRGVFAPGELLDGDDLSVTPIHDAHGRSDFCVAASDCYDTHEDSEAAIAAQSKKGGA